MMRFQLSVLFFGVFGVLAAHAATVDGAVFSERYRFPCRAAQAQALEKAEMYCAERGQTLLTSRYSNCWNDTWVNQSVTHSGSVTETRTEWRPITKVRLGFGCTGGVH